MRTGKTATSRDATRCGPTSVEACESDQSYTPLFSAPEVAIQATAHSLKSLSEPKTDGGNTYLLLRRDLFNRHAIEIALDDGHSLAFFEFPNKLHDATQDLETFK